MNRSLLTDGALVGMAAVAFLFVGSRYLAHGWFTISDLFVAVGVGALLVSLLLPHVVRTNLALLVLLVAGLEGVFYLVNQLIEGSPDEITELVERVDGGGPTRLPDEDLGYKPTPGVSLTTQRLFDGKPLFTARYTFDDRGRRLVPLENAEGRDDFLVFLGCSVTFGSGVGDRETLPFHVARLSPRHRAFNYAFGGYGPQHMLAKLRTGDVEKELTGGKGKFVYVFIDDHVNRAISSMRTVWVHRSPYYLIDANGELVRDRNFNVARPYLYALYRDILLKSQTLKFFHVDVPPVIGADHIELTARIIEASAQEVRARFKTDEFYVVIYPVGTERLGGPLKRRLEQGGIKVLDYSGKIRWEDDFVLHAKFDVHPTGKANEAVAERLAADLGTAGRVENAPRATMRH